MSNNENYDYKKMYHDLFNAMTTAISILQEAQKEVEESYISSKTAPVVQLTLGREDDLVQKDVKSGSH